MPTTASAAWDQVGMDAGLDGASYDEAAVVVEVGQPIPTPAMLFAKIEDKTIQEMEEILEKRVSEATKKKHVTFEEFSELDLRIGTIVSAEPIKKSKKLLRLLVDLGETRDRQIVAGIAETHKPDDLVGRQVVVLANMQPAKLFGVESRGMILAGDSDGAILLMPEREVPAGTAVA